MLLGGGQANAQCSVGAAIHKGCLDVGYAGCCEVKESVGGAVTVVQWCEAGYLCQLICNPYLDPNAALCGWDASQNIYNCMSNTFEDPSGQNPWACDIPCGNVPPAGCCEGQTLLKSCKNGKMGIVNCAANGEGLQFCGWDPVHQYYACAASPAPGPASHPYTCGESTCTPDCADKMCGPDGCDGYCGTCTSGYHCDAAGKCVTDVCQPECKFKDCGPDGCGGSCGTCGGDYVCNTDQKCVTQPCEPHCTNKECGSDLCGGVCGVCAPPKACSAWFKCVGPDEEVALLPDTAGDSGLKQDATTGPDDVPDPGSATTDEGQLNSLNSKRCPDGFVSSYGKCVASPPASHKTGSGACVAGRGGPDHARGIGLVMLFCLIILRGYPMSAPRRN